MPTLRDEPCLRFGRDGSQILSQFGISDDAEQRHQYLVEARLKLGIDQARIQFRFESPVKAIEQELVAQLAGLRFDGLGEIDRDVGAKLARSHFLGDEAALQALVVISATCRHDLGTIDLERLRIEFALPVHHGAQDRHTAHIAVVENLDNIRLRVAEAEIGLIQYQCAAKSVQRMEDRRDRRGAACEKRLVAERADRQERTRLAAAKVAAQPQIRQLVERIVNPGEKDVVGGHFLEGRAEIDVAMDERLYLGDKLVLAAEDARFGRQQYRFVGNEIVVRRERDKRYAAACRDTILQRPAPGAPDREKCLAPLRVVHQLDHRAVVENGRCRRHGLFLFLSGVLLHATRLRLHRKKRREGFLPAWQISPSSLDHSWPARYVDNGFA